MLSSGLKINSNDNKTVTKNRFHSKIVIMTTKHIMKNERLLKKNLGCKLVEPMLY